MRLKSIGIANFKAYGPSAQTIPIRPITLIFGANSSGKSSLLHSLLWLNHASIRRDADVFEPILAEKTVHLGGFDSCIHQNSKGKAVKTWLELEQIDLSAADLEIFPRPLSVKMGLGIKRRSEGEAPSLAAWELSLDDQKLMSGTGCEPNLADTLKINWEHPFLQCFSALDDVWRRHILHAFENGGLGPGTYSLETHGIVPSRMFLDQFARFPLDNEYEETGTLDEQSEQYPEILAKKQFINKVRYGLPAVLSDFLGGFVNVIEGLRYLPPLRSVPQRFENLRICTNPSWRKLADDSTLVDSVNNTLKRLCVAHELDVRKLVPEQECNDPSDYLIQLRIRDTRTDAMVNLQDVGVGTGQILPVVIEAHSCRNRLIAIEQPELHLHPALQAELGDVFIESALGENKNTFLLETHSEHLILRILRRIRETTEGDFSDWSDELKKACPDGIRPEDVAVLYVKPGEDGAQVETLRINELGEFVDEWPGGFFDERIREIL